MWYRSLLIRRTICLDIAHACESWHSRRSCCSAIFKQTVVNQLTFPTEGRKTHTRNPIESVKEASLFRLGNLIPSARSIRARALWEFSCDVSQKKEVTPVGHMPLANTASRLSCCRLTNDIISRVSSWASWDDQGWEHLSLQACIASSYPLFVS